MTPIRQVQFGNGIRHQFGRQHIRHELDADGLQGGDHKTNESRAVSPPL